MKTSFAITPEYAQFVAELKARIHAARICAARAVNRDLILLYWDIGRALVEKQQYLGWGEAVVARLAADLRSTFPDTRGFSEANVWRMKQLYLVHSTPAFLAQAVRELKQPALAPQELAQAVRELVGAIPWGHHVLLLGRVTDPLARLYYLRATARFGWSRNVLLNQLKAGAYERAVLEKKTHNFPLALPAHLAEQADEMLKSRYNLEFLGIHHHVRERELEDRLIAQLERFILELGYGFCFIGRQYRLALGATEYFVSTFLPDTT
jgi:predicted nuclease of restriction endonuclease-like (RecB) superfamily